MSNKKQQNQNRENARKLKEFVVMYGERGATLSSAYCDKGIALGQTVADVINEVIRAKKKFPNSRHLLAALTEEVGEVAQAMLEKEYEPEKGVTQEDIVKECTQIAAVAIRLILEGDSSFSKRK